MKTYELIIEVPFQPETILCWNRTENYTIDLSEYEWEECDDEADEKDSLSLERMKNSGNTVISSLIDCMEKAGLEDEVIMEAIYHLN